jgi:hypothetical protein
MMMVRTMTTNSTTTIITSTPDADGRIRILAEVFDGNATITTADDVGALLDELAHLLADVPGSHPYDVTVAARLARLTWTLLTRQDTTPVLQLLWQYGIAPEDALVIAQAQRALYLRLGAWLGRARA